jgi:hypothetical protein
VESKSSLDLGISPFCSPGGLEPRRYNLRVKLSVKNLSLNLWGFIAGIVIKELLCILSPGVST